MSNTLTARVRLDVSDVDRKLSNLEKRINNINNGVNNLGKRQSRFTRVIDTINNKLNTTQRKVHEVDSANNKAANSANKMAKGYEKANKGVSVLTKNLRTLVSTYVGIMGAKAIANAADTLTGAENQLNYINSQQLGDKGFTTGSDGKQTFSVDTINATQDALDKMYAASMRARTGYGEMQKNVGKTMMLAGDAFQNNTDNAIRFQEVMAKAYKLGNQSAAEQASSMYQLVQALGSGRLQGDELRSLIEGAPKAATIIEDYAQKLYGTTDAIKDMASQGLITSEIVVAAIMDGGEAIDEAFKHTKATFADTMKAIQSMGKKAFEPVLRRLTDIINSDVGKAILDGIGKAFVVLANTILWVMDILGKFFSWCSDNWYWLQWVVLGVITAIIVGLGVMAVQATITAVTMFVNFLMTLSPIYWIIIAIGATIAVMVYLAKVTGSAAEFITMALLTIAAAAMIVGIFLNMPWLVWVGIALTVIALVLNWFMTAGDKIMGYAYVIGAWFVNVWNWIKNVAIGVWDALCAIANDIKLAFVNAWYYCKADFWDFVSDVYSGVLKVANLINKVLGVFGIEIDTSSLEAAVNKAKGNAETNRSQKLTYQDVTDAYTAGASTYTAFESGWSEDAYNKGAKVGSNIQNTLNSTIGGLKDKISNFGVSDLFGFFGSLGDKWSVLDPNKTEGLKTTDVGSYLPDPNDPALALGKGYDPSNVLKKIKDDTGAMADSMELSEDDLQFLRDVANMEWKKEFTTASIKVDMSNYNTVSGDGDLDGIVTRLTEKLYEELDMVANGVYA